MYYWAVFIILIAAGGMYSQTQSSERYISDQADLDSLSRNILVYRSAVAVFAQENPAFSGMPSDEALKLPSWFNKPPGVTGLIADGTAYTFYSGAMTPGLPSALQDRTESVVIGIKRSGALESPRAGHTTILLPPQIPDGAVVAIN